MMWLKEEYAGGPEIWGVDWNIKFILVAWYLKVEIRKKNITLQGLIL